MLRSPSPRAVRVRGSSRRLKAVRNQLAEVPPQLTPWKKGQSGNPGGRPKALFSQAIRKLAEQKASAYPHFAELAEKYQLDPEETTIAELQAFVATINGMGAGGAAHLGIGLDRMEGKVADRLEVAGTAEQPAVRFEFVEADPPEETQPPDEGETE